jgi:serine phosphatase RsbU (regulator of sigma subunit)/MFS family permease
MAVEFVGRSPMMRTAWWGITLVTITVAVIGFGNVLEGPTETLIQGPFAVDPNLGDRLEAVLSASFISWSQLAIHVVGFGLFVALGMLIAARSSERMPLLASAMLITLATSLFVPFSKISGPWAAIARVIGEVTPDQMAGFWISVSGILLLAFLLLVPSGRPKRAAVVVLASLVLLGIAAAVFPGWAFDPHTLPSPWRHLWTIAVPVGAMATTWIRLARLDDAVRRQWQPVLVALSVIVGTYLVLVLLRPELQTDAFGLVLVTPRLQALYGLNTLLLLTGAVFALPFSIVLAVVRYRLFEIDLLVNRALVYGSLTAIVTVMFGAVTLVTVFVIGGLLGQGMTGLPIGQTAALAGVLTGSVLAGSLRPLRRRVQRAVDRRFYREKFNAEEALERLVARLGDVVDRELLNAEVDSLFAATLQPTWATLVRTDQLPPGLDPAGTEPQISPQPGIAAVVPLLVSGDPIGALLMGDRKSGVPYRGIELAFLRRVADRLGPALRIVELVERQEADRTRRESVEQELSVARRIQRELLPREVPQPPGWAFTVHYEPAREVGGDFYDFYNLGPGRMGIAVGDVTDKGMPAALVMASCRTVLRGTALGDLELTPGAVLAQANGLLVGDIPRGMFVTCLFGVLELDTGRFWFANAGHNPPQHRHRDGSSEVRARGMPLGLLAGMFYEEMEVALEPGDGLILSSDGITECRNPTGEMFGFDRLSATISTARRGAIETLLAAQSEFVGKDWVQEDDITLVEITRGPSAG